MSRNKKILIIGSKGMAGHVIYYFLKENTSYDIVDIARDDSFFEPSYKFDITDFDKLASTLSAEQPDIVINCIGILNKDAEDHPDKAILLNSYLPHFLASKGEQSGFRLIHISTDCVFNGRKGNYSENSVKDGIGFYAESKALGEVVYKNNLTLRTSIIGPELKLTGIGLFDWFMKQSGDVKGYVNAIWSGVTTLELSKAILEAIKQELKGLHHLVNETSINKFDLLILFKKIFSKDDLCIVPFEDYIVDKSLIISNRDFNYKVPGYGQMLIELKDWIQLHTHLYANSLSK